MTRLGAPATLAAAACSLAAAATAWFVRAESSPPSFDEAWYLEVSFKLFHALRGRGPLAFAREYAQAFRFKAPLAAVLPLPAYFAFGPSYAAAVLTNLPALALLSLSLYGLGRRLSSPTAGGLAAVFGLMLPLTAALSRTFYVETWLTALTAAFLWRLSESDQLRRPREAPFLGVLLGLGLLSKVLFPGVIAGPVALTLWERRRDPRGPDWPAIERPLKVLLGLAATVALTWYGPNLIYVVGFAYSAYRGDIGAHYGSGGAWDPARVAGYYRMIGHDVLSYYVVLLFAGLCLLLGRRGWEAPGLRLAAAWAAPYLLLTTSGLAKEQRYLDCVLPAAALALAVLLDGTTAGKPGRPLRLGLAVAPLAYLFALQTFGSSLIPAPPAVLSGMFPERTTYGGPPRNSPAWDLERLPGRLAGVIGSRAVIVVGCEHGRLNANLLAAWAARGSLPLSFINYGHMEEHVERAVARLSEKDATHILFIDGLDPRELPQMVPRVDAALRRLIDTGRLPFRLVRRFDLAPGSDLSAELWERTAPIRMTGDPGDPGVID